MTENGNFRLFTSSSYFKRQNQIIAFVVYGLLSLLTAAVLRDSGRPSDGVPDHKAFWLF
jgi:hypothetical protein